MLITFLRANVDVFSWQPSDIPGVPREVIEHHLAVCPHARPVKQKVRKQALEWQQFIAEDIKKLEAAGLVRGVLHPTWFTNPVVVSKEDEEKTAYISPCGTYCFVCMPFRLKSAGSTFARAVQIGFEPQLDKNVEAYMDDIVVKTKDKSTLIQDLEETFANLRKIN